MDGLELDTKLLTALAEHTGLSAAAIAREAKVSHTTISRPMSGTATTRLGQRTLEKLAKAFPTFPGWSHTGENATISYQHLENNPQPPSHVSSEHTRSYRHESPAKPDLVELDQIDLRYGLGGTYSDVPIEVERRSFSREWLRSITRASPDHLFWASGDGDSMEPTIRSGEIVLIDRSQDTPRIGDGIWALAMGEIGMIKRLRYLPGGEIEIHSDNPQVPPYRAAEDELHVVGRVIAVVRRL